MSLAAQFGVFNEAFSGELWAVRHELMPGGGATPAGLAYVNGTLFVADSSNRTVIAYDGAGQVVPKPGAQWTTAGFAALVPGFVPHQLAAVVVNVDGTDRDAILISDSESNRVAAFDAAGTYLFTMRLERPSSEPTFSLSIGELATYSMSPGAEFNLTNSGQTLTLSGSFAAGWVEQKMTGSVDSGALVFQGSATPFPLVSSEFLLTPTTILRGTETDPVAPDPQYVFGVAYDTVGNLYVLDAFTERLHVYGPDLSHLFTFGTPVADGTTAEFYEPWGMVFWPDGAGTGGRLFINDTYNSRILIYRPVDGPDSGDTVDALQFESVIKNFVAPDPELFSIAFDPSTGALTVTDFAVPRVVVLQRARLATFDFQVLDASDGVVDSVCTGAQYKVRFSLTVPAGLADVTGVVPQLAIDGVPTSAPPVPSDVYPSSTLSAGQVVTYTTTLTAPDEADADIQVIAGATATNTTDILMRSEVISLSECAGETDPSTITATPITQPDLSIRLPQVSGWTPVFEGETFAVRLDAQDNDGIESIEYRLEGANQTGDEPVSVAFNGVQTDASVVVPIPESGNTTLSYRVRDGNMIWSGWQPLDVRLVRVIDRQNNENTGANFAVGVPIGSGFTFSATGLPPGVTIDESTGQIAGILDYQSAGVYTVVVTETLGAASSNVSFTWTVLNINQFPVIEQPALTPATEGEFFSLQIVGYDPDGDAAFFTVGYDLPPSITIDPSTGLISGIFPSNSQREYAITVGLSECAISTPANPLPNPPCTVDVPGERLATLVSFTLQVIDVNLAPLAINPGPQSNTEGDVVTLPIVASDPDLQTLTYTAGGLPQGLSIDANIGVISGTLSSTSSGNHAVTVTVSDGIADPPVAVTFAWTVADSVNHAPTIVSPDRTNIEGETVIAQMVASDLDDDPLTYTISGLPTGLSMNAAGLVTGTLGFNDAGDYPVTLTVSDGTATTTATFVWHVLNVNRHPVLVGVNQLSVEGQTVAYQVDGTDPDGDDLTFSMNGLPAGFSIDPDSGIISGTFTYESAGVYTVNVGVNDGALAVLATFTWTVSDTNRAPTVTNPGPQSNFENDTVLLPITAGDPDGNPVTYSAMGLPPGLAIDPLTGVIGGTLTYSAAGNYSVTVKVSDGNLETPVTFAWTVTNVNRPPDVVKPADQNSAGGAVIVLPVMATDPDLQTLTYSATGLPPDLAINASTGVISGTISYSIDGTSTVTVRASDGAASDSETFTWVVTSTNSPPTCVATATPSVIWPPNHKKVYLSVTGVTDPEGGAVTIRYTGILQDEPTDSVGQGNTLQDGGIEDNGARAWVRAERSGNPGGPGDGRIYLVSYTATDAAQASCTGVVALSVPHDQSGAPAVLSPGRWNSITGQQVSGFLPPDAVHDAVTVKKGQATTITVLSNDIANGQTLTVAIVTPPSIGLATLNANGTITYQPPAGATTGTTSFTYRVTTPSGATDTATVTVTIKK